MAMPRARMLRGPGRVLVVSADPALARFVQLTVNHGVYATKAVGGTAVAIDAVALWKPHLVVVDIDRPDDDGLDLVRSREERRDRLPLIALTKRGDLKTKLAAFEAGVDDIVTVPFSPEELVAPVLALMRRTYRDHLPLLPGNTLARLQIDPL